MVKEIYAITKNALISQGKIIMEKFLECRSFVGSGQTIDIKRDQKYEKNGRLGKDSLLLVRGLKWVLTNKNGQLFSVTNYKIGRKDGPWITYNNNGMIIEKGVKIQK